MDKTSLKPEEMLGRRGLTISAGIALGNDRYDHDTLKAAKVAMASPLADEDTRHLVTELNGLVIADYASFLKDLEAEI